MKPMPVLAPNAQPFSRPSATRMMTKTTTPTMAMVRYWRLRYARAPSCTAAATERIFSSPAGSLSSHMMSTAP